MAVAYICPSRGAYLRRLRTLTKSTFWSKIFFLYVGFRSAKIPKPLFFFCHVHPFFYILYPISDNSNRLCCICSTSKIQILFFSPPFHIIGNAFRFYKINRFSCGRGGLRGTVTRSFKRLESGITGTFRSFFFFFCDIPGPFVRAWKKNHLLYPYHPWRKWKVCILIHGKPVLPC